MSHVLAIDIGTSSVRAALYDAKGNVLPETMVKNERVLTATEDGGAEIDATEAFGQIVEAIDDVLKKSRNVKGEIEYVAASSFWHSLVGVDAKGKPTTRVFGWADTRSRQNTSPFGAKNLTKRKFTIERARVFIRATGRQNCSGCKKNSQEVFKKTAKWLSFSDFVALEAFSARVSSTSVSMASGTGIFDIQKIRLGRRIVQVF